MAGKKSQNAFYSHFASFLKLQNASRDDLAKKLAKSGKSPQKRGFCSWNRKMPQMIEISDLEARLDTWGKVKIKYGRKSQEPERKKQEGPLLSRRFLPGSHD
jgi:hypothetical protein